MTDIALNMKNELVPLQGKAAAEVTHALKSMGSSPNTSMVDALIQRLDMVIAEKDYFEMLSQFNFNKGLLIGGGSGLFIGGVVCATYFRRKEKRKLSNKSDSSKAS